jgi:hypothetical protein
MAHTIVSCGVVYECFGESSELADASCVISLINKAFALSVELILSSMHCDCMLLFEIGIEFSQVLYDGDFVVMTLAAMSESRWNALRVALKLDKCAAICL